MKALLFCSNECCGTPTTILPYMARPDILWVKCKGCDILISINKPEIKNFIKQYSLPGQAS